MPRLPRRDPSPNATLRHIAAAAGVSQMTVSRALGGRGRIATETQKRIVALAEKLGYRPDPVIAKLMHHLRNRRMQRFQSVIMGLTTRPPGDREEFFRAVVAGAEGQARRRGYGFAVMHVSPGPKGWSGVHRMLRNRGIEGLLLLPQHAPVDLGGLLDWKQFSVVAATASAIAPVVHRVMPHHFANTLLLCRRLAERGHHRIGLVITAEHDLRSAHGFTAAVTWHGTNEARHLVPPLVTRGTAAEAVRAWFEREKPDAIITNEARSSRECARFLGRKLSVPLRFAVTSVPREPRRDLWGIDERPAAIGSAALDLLAGMVEHGVRGPPESPASTLLPGRWVE